MALPGSPALSKRQMTVLGTIVEPLV
jgi:hypothetical protein